MFSIHEDGKKKKKKKETKYAFMDMVAKAPRTVFVCNLIV